MGCPAIALCSRCAVCESACGELLCVAGELCVRVHADKKKEVQVEGYK